MSNGSALSLKSILLCLLASSFVAVGCKMRESQLQKSTFSSSENERHSDFTYSQLENLINSPQVRSVDQLLEKLPESFRSRVVLMHRSESAQYAHPLYPRVIMFSEDASLIIAFTGWPINLEDFTESERPKVQETLAKDGALMRDSIEVIHFDPRQKTQLFQFKQVIFPAPGSTSVTKILDGTSERPFTRNCHECHGSPIMKPNWETYAIWPGAYGSLDDYILPESLEGRNYRQFVEKVSNKSRYQYLANLGPLRPIKVAVTKERSERNYGESLYEVVGYKDDIYWAAARDSRYYQGYPGDDSQDPYLRPRPALKLLMELTRRNNTQIVSILKNINHAGFQSDLKTLLLPNGFELLTQAIAKRQKVSLQEVLAEIERVRLAETELNEKTTEDILYAAVREYFPHVNRSEFLEFGQKQLHKWDEFSGDVAAGRQPRQPISKEEQLIGRVLETNFSLINNPNISIVAYLGVVQYLLNIHEVPIELSGLTTPFLPGLRDDIGAGIGKYEIERLMLAQ